MTHRPTGPSGSPVPLLVRTAQLRTCGGQLWQIAEQTSADLNLVYPALTAPCAANPDWAGSRCASDALRVADGMLTWLATALNELSRSVVAAADAYDGADEQVARRTPRTSPTW